MTRTIRVGCARYALALVALMSWLASTAQIRADETSSQTSVLQQIIAAWEARQQEVRTVHFAWRTERTDRKGSISEFMKRLGSKADESAPMPAADTTYTSDDEVWFDGRRVRWESYGPEPIIGTDNQGTRFVSMKKVSVFDGEQSLQYQLSDNDELPKQGYKLKGRPLPIQTALNAKPVFAFVRPFDRSFGYIDKTALRVSHLQETPAGGSQVVLERQARNARRERYWVDPKVAHGIVRYAIESPPGKVEHQLDVSYRPDPAHGWLPEKWTVTSFSKGGAVAFVQSCQTTTLVLNEPIADRTFQVEFPDSTRVVDGMGNDFIAGKDGQLKPFSPETAGSRQSSATKSLAIFMGFAAVVAILFVMWRKRHSTSADPRA
jgi:hypothetical protein